MSWSCRLVPAPGDDPGDTPWKELRVGDMWFAPYLLEDGHWKRGSLSPRYWALPEPRRAPLVVRLPGPCDFVLDTMAWRSEPGDDGVNRSKFYGDGWEVSGAAPLITLTPSINVQGCYHGYIQNGVITDDVEGRRFDENGRTPRT